MDNIENKDSNDSPDTASKESSAYSESKHFSTHADFIWLKNKFNTHVGLNKTFKKQFNFINADINKLTEEKNPHLTSTISTIKNEIEEFHHDSAKQAQDISDISSKLTIIMNSLPQTNGDFQSKF